jgi:hypothetical protein
MKKYLFAAAAGFITALATINPASAQSSNAIKILHNDVSVEKKFKSDISAEPVKENTVAVISSKALKSFSKSYKNAADASWDLTTEGYRVKFTEGAIKNSVFYNKSGAWTGSLKTYQEDGLPKDVRGTIKSEYYDYSIYQVQEVETLESTDHLPTYIIYMEDKNSYKTLLVNDFNITVWKDFKK